MPILATTGRDFTGRPVVIPDDARRLEFVSLDGSDLIDWSGDEWIARAGATGLDLPPRERIAERIPGMAGTRLQEIRDLEREVFLPLNVRVADRDWRTLLARLAALRSFLNYRDRDYATAEGTFDLVAYGDNTRRTLRCTYDEGLEGDYGSDTAFSEWQLYGLKLTASDPYWHGEQWSTPVVSLPKVAPFLSNSVVDAFPRSLSASVALGANMAVTVGGDVPSAPVIAGTGPWTSMHITSPQGLDVTIGAVGAGHTLLLDTGRQLQCLRDGVADWTLVGDSPQWRPLPPGDASISIVVAGATTATSARVYGTSLWETAW